MTNTPTEGMSIDVLSYMGKKHLLEECPELKDIKGIANYLSTPDRDGYRNKVVIYIILLYSQDSILNKLTQLSLRERKMKAAEYAELPKDKKGEFTRRVSKDIFELNGDGVVECIFDYLKYQNNYLWTLICTNEALLDQYTYSMFKTIEMDDAKKENEALVKKRDMRKEMREITQDLKEFYKEFYKDHKDVKDHEVTKKRSIEERARVKK